MTTLPDFLIKCGCGTGMALAVKFFAQWQLTCNTGSDTAGTDAIALAHGGSDE